MVTTKKCNVYMEQPGKTHGHYELKLRAKVTLSTCGHQKERGVYR